MPKITAIKEQKQKNRFNVYVDEKFAIGLSAEALVKAGLKAGQEISKKEIEKLRNKDIEGKLYNRALRFLSYRPRSEKEVRDYLRKKIRAKKIGENRFSISSNQGTSKTVGQIVSKLKSQNLIDDQEFAKWWIEQRQAFRPKGIYALKQELQRKGIGDSLITQLLNPPAGGVGYLITPETEQRTAKKLVKKRREQLKGLPYLELKQKLTRFLVYRGFSYQTIKLALDEVLEKK